MAKSYVNFTVSAEVVAKTLEALQLAKQNGAIKKGANEVTKSVERGLATFVVLAEDIEPEEVVVHIPKLCEAKKIAYSYVPKKIDLGKAIGMNVPCAAVAVENQGSAQGAIRDIITRITGTSKKEEKKTEAPKPAAPKEEKKQAPKKEKPAAPAQASPQAPAA
jgi:large subunit ribosomal protein L7Ae